MLNDTYLKGIRSNWSRAWNGNLTTLDWRYRTDGRALVLASALKPQQLEIVSRPDTDRNNGTLGDEGCENVIPDIQDGYEQVHPVGLKPAGEGFEMARAVFQAAYSDISTHLDAHAIVTIAKAAGVTRVFAKDDRSPVILHAKNEFVGLIMPIRKEA